MLKNLPASMELAFERWADQPIRVVDAEGESHPTRLSDHYGVIATMPPGAD
jgi:hypothetical protein